MMSDTAIGTIMFLDQLLPDFAVISELAGRLHIDKSQARKELSKMLQNGKDDQTEDLFMRWSHLWQAKQEELIELVDPRSAIASWVWLAQNLVPLRRLVATLKYQVGIDWESELESLQPPIQLRGKIKRYVRELEQDGGEFDFLLGRLYSDLPRVLSPELVQLSGDQQEWSGKYVTERDLESPSIGQSANMLRSWQHREVEYAEQALYSTYPADVVWRYFLRLRYYFYDLRLLTISTVSNVELNIEDLINYS